MDAVYRRDVLGTFFFIIFYMIFLLHRTGVVWFAFIVRKKFDAFGWEVVLEPPRSSSTAGILPIVDG